MSTPGADQIEVNGFHAVICSEPMRKLMQMVERVARNNAAVLITGETGSGKEFVARALHHHSLRCNRPWIDVNCAALPEHLVESELFGYEKGAFSGADAMKQGMFELANSGTLFLDEIGELEPKVQVKLLRVLDGVPYYRLGGNKKVTTDVRIIAATNQDLEAAVRNGRFRSDLYHRLGQIQLRIPPLRERPEDIDALAAFFLKQHRPDQRFSSEALRILRMYPWPGNVRELRNVVLQTSMLVEGLEIQAHDLPSEIFTSRGVTSSTEEEPARSDTSDLDEIERQTIMKTLMRTGGHQGLAAEQLGISRRTLSRKLKQYNMRASDMDGAPSFGVLSPDQQQYYRAAIELPVHIKTSRGLECGATTINMSAGGMAVKGIENPLVCSGLLQIRFPLPESEQMAEAKARIAWADVEKRAGLKFVEINPDAVRHIEKWLNEKQREEGWHVEAHAQ